MVNLHSLHPVPGASKKRKRVGRGESSGHGKTSCRGSKGQKARSGVSLPSWFEGGQMPLTRRAPKRGFNNYTRTEYCVVNLDHCALLELESGTPITPELLRESGLVKERDARIKILGRGDLAKPLQIHAHAFSRSAVQKITAAGGKVEVLDK